MAPNRLVGFPNNVPEDSFDVAFTFSTGFVSVLGVTFSTGFPNGVPVEGEEITLTEAVSAGLEAGVSVGFENNPAPDVNAEPAPEPKIDAVGLEASEVFPNNPVDPPKSVPEDVPKTEIGGALDASACGELEGFPNTDSGAFSDLSSPDFSAGTETFDGELKNPALEGFPKTLDNEDFSEAELSLAFGVATSADFCTILGESFKSLPTVFDPKTSEDLPKNPPVEEFAAPKLGRLFLGRFEVKVAEPKGFGSLSAALNKLVLLGVFAEAPGKVSPFTKGVDAIKVGFWVVLNGKVKLASAETATGLIGETVAVFKLLKLETFLLITVCLT